jgi:hypothetical protein
MVRILVLKRLHNHLDKQAEFQQGTWENSGFLKRVAIKSLSAIVLVALWLQWLWPRPCIWTLRRKINDFWRCTWIQGVKPLNEDYFQVGQRLDQRHTKVGSPRPDRTNQFAIYLSNQPRSRIRKSQPRN